MKFIRFDLEKHSFCKYDSVEVKDGWERTSPHLGRYCGVNPIRGVSMIFKCCRIAFKAIIFN